MFSIGSLGPNEARYLDTVPGACLSIGGRALLVIFPGALPGALPTGQPVGVRIGPALRRLVLRIVTLLALREAFTPCCVPASIQLLMCDTDCNCHTVMLRSTNTKAEAVRC
jgi:hypothetical protein